jgi:ABC-type transporter MlaC component
MKEFDMKYRSNRKTARLVTCVMPLLILVILTGCQNPASDEPGTTPGSSAAPTAAAEGSAVYLDQNGKATFTLTSTHAAEAVWKVYTQQQGGEIRSGVTVESYDAAWKTLTLAVTPDGTWPVYCWVSVTEPGKTESSRILLTITGPYTAEGESRPPTVGSLAAAAVAKTAASQNTVSFTLSNAPAGTWKVYGSADGGDVVADVTASVSDSTLTLTASGADLAPGTYYVAVTESGKTESSRLALTVGAYVPPEQTGTPTASVTTVAKTTATQKAINFTLTSNHTGDLLWKVYNVELGGTPMITVSASFTSSTLTLTASGDDLAAATYYVTVTQGALAESNRLALTVGAYVPPQPSDTPAASVTTVTKTAATQKVVPFILTSSSTGTWKVYDTAIGGTALETVSAAFASPALTLTASGDDLAAGDYYVTVTESGKTESLRLKLTVAAYAEANQTAQPTVSESTVTKDTATQQAVAFTLTSGNTGTWKVYSNAISTDVVAGVTASASDSTLTLTASGADLAAADYYVTVTESEKTESPRLRLTVKNPLFGTIQVQFTGPAEETISLSGNSPTLSISSNTSMVVTVTQTFDTYAWYKDGASTGVTTNYITVTATEFAKGEHTLAVKVGKNDAYYSKSVSFTVTD